MNCYIGTAGSDIAPISLDPAYKVYTKSSQFEAADPPAGRFVFTDANPANTCTPAFGVDMSLQIWIHYPSYFHQRQGVLAFADGHVESHEWEDARTMPQLANGQSYISHKNSSPANPDLAWIVAQTTSKKQAATNDKGGPIPSRKLPSPSRRTEMAAAADAHGAGFPGESLRLAGEFGKQRRTRRCFQRCIGFVQIANHAFRHRMENAESDPWRNVFR